ncbi:hypothetical protein [Methylobacterium soli]|uniref:hypothetical protein n=1 Tax=Methylobacterium soli TaxID=553447 RepID=UPI0017876A3D|nr:hypothetical protein [Methylobacterium soli]
MTRATVEGDITQAAMILRWRTGNFAAGQLAIVGTIEPTTRGTRSKAVAEDRC